MAQNELTIETGIDQLIKLVREVRKISLSSAAKRLGIPQPILTEWINLLDEEGVLKVSYVFTTPYIEMKNMSGTEFQRKENELAVKKKEVAKKLETTVGSIDENSQAIGSLRLELEKMSAELSTELGDLKNKINDIKGYEELKAQAQDSATEEENKFKSMLASLDSQLEMEMKKYAEFIKEVRISEKELSRQKKQVHSIEQQESALQKKLDSISKMIARLGTGKPSDPSLMSKMSSSEIKQVQVAAVNMRDQIQKEIQEKKTSLLALSKQVDIYEKKIRSMEIEMLDLIEKQKADKAGTKGRKVDTLKKAEKFFQHKKKADIILHKAERDVEFLRKQLESLLNKAIALKSVSESKKVRQHIRELKMQISLVSHKHNSFKKEVAMLQKSVQNL